jgi:CRP/FNR family transcriptional regulator, nitrogen fixation regulation protein
MLIRSSNTTNRPPCGLDQFGGESSLWSEFKYPQGSEIFGEAEPADYVYQIRQGAVRTYKLLSDGRRQIGAFHLPGDIFGVENGDVHRFTAEAIVDTTVWIAKCRSLFAGLAKGHICTAKAVRDLVSRSLEHVENHLLLLGRQTSLERVAAFLAELDHRLGQPAVVTLPMNRRDVADYLGLTLETVSRAMSILRDEHILSFIGKTQREIVLHDRLKLARHAFSSATPAEPILGSDDQLEILDLVPKPSQDHHGSLDPLYHRPGGEEAANHPTPHQGIGE